MLYELLKTAYYLPRQEKETVLENFQSIVREAKYKFLDEQLKKIKDKKKIKIEDNLIDPDKGMVTGNGEQWDSAPFRHDIASADSLIKTARAHDPETKEQILKLMDLMDEFLSNKNDISYDHICVFLNPLIIGSKKVLIRPYRVVGLARKLEFICKKYQRFLKVKHNKRIINYLNKEFKATVDEIKSRMQSDPEPPISEVAIPSPINVKDKKLILHKSAGLEGDGVSLIRRLIESNPRLKDESLLRKLLIDSGSFTVSEDDIRAALNP